MHPSRDYILPLFTLVGGRAELLHRGLPRRDLLDRAVTRGLPGRQRPRRLLHVRVRRRPHALQEPGKFCRCRLLWHFRLLMWHFLLS